MRRQTDLWPCSLSGWCPDKAVNNTAAAAASWSCSERPCCPLPSNQSWRRDTTTSAGACWYAAPKQNTQSYVTWSSFEKKINNVHFDFLTNYKANLFYVRNTEKLTKYIKFIALCLVNRLCWRPSPTCFLTVIYLQRKIAVDTTVAYSKVALTSTECLKTSTISCSDIASFVPSAFALGTITELMYTCHKHQCSKVVINDIHVRTYCDAEYNSLFLLHNNYQYDTGWMWYQSSAMRMRHATSISCGMSGCMGVVQAVICRKIQSFTVTLWRVKTRLFSSCQKHKVQSTSLKQHQ